MSSQKSEFLSSSHLRRRQHMRFSSIVGIFVILVFVFAGCVAGPNKLEKTQNEEGEIAGFWKGL
jgi:hypothetical protein